VNFDEKDLIDINVVLVGANAEHLSVHRVQTDPQGTVRDLMQSIERSQGTPVARQSLVFAGRRLKASNTLASERVFRETSVYLCVATQDRSDN